MSDFPCRFFKPMSLVLPLILVLAGCGKNDGYECKSDDECVFLPVRSCCPGPPDPCERGQEVGTLDDQNEILRWKEENCDESVECPQYSPPLCGNCHNLFNFESECAEGQCVRVDTIDCDQLCQAAAKNPKEACPFVSHPDLLTEENIHKCGCGHVLEEVERLLCEETNGRWDLLACGFTWCGMECYDPINDTCDCDLRPGCDCGPGRNFVDWVGCQTDVACGAVACAATPELSLPIGRPCGEDADCADLGDHFCAVFNPQGVGEYGELAFCTRSCTDDADCGSSASCQGVWCSGAMCMPDGCCQSHEHCAAGEICEVHRPGGLCQEGPCCSEPHGAFSCLQTCPSGFSRECPPTAPLCESVRLTMEDYGEYFYVCLP